MVGLERKDTMGGNECHDGLEDFRNKLRRELRTGLISLLLMDAIDAAGEEAYGYSIMHSLEEYGGGFLRFKEGTVYPILHSLRNQGLVTAEWKESPSGPARRCYRLTPTGKKALQAALEEWSGLTEMARKLLSRRRGS